MKTRSLAQQTLGTVLSAQLLCALILCGVALQHERHTRFRAFDTRLQGLSDSLLGAIQDAEDPDDNVAIDPAELRLPGEDVYAVYNQGGRLIGTSAIAPATLIARGKDDFRDVALNGVSYRVLQREALRVIDRAENGGVGLRRPVTIVYAAPEGHVWHEILEAAGFYAATVALVALSMVLLLTILLRRALLPLSELASAAAKVSDPSLVFAAPASALRIRELQPLATGLTDTLRHLREAFAREQRFVGDAAHELKTAMAVVHSSVQVLMLRPRSPAEYFTGLSRILEDTQRVEALITQMLQLARLEKGSNTTQPPVDLASSIDSVLTMLQPIAEHRGVELHVHTSPSLLVRLLPDSADILLSNLVLNAIQHSNRGCTVYVTASRIAEDRIRLEVGDSGSGISAEALPHIFERFYREDTSRSRETGGTGLGLATCKSIVEGAKGTIEAESEQGTGTRIVVTFSPA